MPKYPFARPWSYFSKVAVGDNKPHCSKNAHAECSSSPELYTSFSWLVSPSAQGIASSTNEESHAGCVMPLWVCFRITVSIVGCKTWIYVSFQLPKIQQVCCKLYHSEYMHMQIVHNKRTSTSHRDCKHCPLTGLCALSVAIEVCIPLTGSRVPTFFFF